MANAAIASDSLDLIKPATEQGQRVADSAHRRRHVFLDGRAVTQLPISVFTPRHRSAVAEQIDRIIELSALGDALERQVNRATRIADRYDHAYHDAETSEQRAVAIGKREEAETAMFDLEEDLSRVDAALEALEG